jgi:hypothetical protein
MPTVLDPGALEADGMTVPIKRGTARRLGLRQPQPIPSFVVKFGEVSDAEREWLREQLEAAAKSGRIRPVSFDFHPEPIKHRPWWMFWRRG